jgi:2,5-diketo-D-gluconate reductase A
VEQWKAIQELKSQGKIKAAGVSNYNQNHFGEIRAENLAMPEYNQIELHPWSQKHELVSYLKENNVAIIAYSSLIPISTWRDKPGQESAKTDEMRAEGQKDDTPFKQMANKYGVSEAQILLRWGVQNGYAVIPKSTNEERIKQNIDLFSFEIDIDDMNTIETMDRGDGVAWSSGDPSQMP